MIIRVVSYNIHKGFSPGNRCFVLPEIKQGLIEVGADLVFLQEVIGENRLHSRRIRNWPEESPLEYLADSIWAHHAYGKNAVYDAGHHGNAILSRYVISEWSNSSISTNRFEHRGVLHSIIRLEECQRDLHCICLHLGLTSGGRKLQLEQLSRQIESQVPDDAPLIIAGDFNDWRASVSRHIATRLEVAEVFRKTTGKYALTFPAVRPVLSLDRIYFRNLSVRTARVLKESPWKRLSDHAALYAEFEI